MCNQQLLTMGCNATVIRYLLSVLFLVSFTAAIVPQTFAGRRQQNITGIIESIDSDHLVVSEVSFEINERTSVKKKGFNFTVADLRSGWNVTVTHSQERVREITVIGIPTVYDFPEYHGIKTRVAVGRVRMGNLPATLVQQKVDIQSGIESIIIAALQSTNRFDVIDIRSRDELLNEVDFSQSAYSNQEIATPVGRQIPARYMIRGHVLSFDSEKKKGGGFGAFGLKVGSSKETLNLKMELTIEEIATGITISSFTDEVSFSAKGSKLSMNVGELASGLSSFTNDIGSLQTLSKVAATGAQFSSTSYYQSPIGEVIGLAVNRLIEKVVEDLGEVSWTSVVVHAVDNTVVIRGGIDVGLRAGSTLELHKSTSDLIDPETGQSLGQIGAAVGLLTVSEVQDKVSICTYSGSDIPVRGDKCVLLQNPKHSKL